MQGRFQQGHCGLRAARIVMGALLLVAPGLALPAETGTPATAVVTASASRPVFEDLRLKSKAFLVVDQDSGETLAAKNADAVVPIASLTKLMTALVVIDAAQDPEELIEITSDDIDREKNTPSRLRVGTRLRRDEMLLLALMASENRSAMALSRAYPGGRPAFLAAMNAKARALGMRHSWFADPAGLSSRSVSTARDLHLLLEAAQREPLIRDYSTRRQYTVRVGRQRLTFVSSNRLVRGAGWDIELQKTGFTNEAGRCLLMQAEVAGRRLALVLLDSTGKLTRYGDVSRVRQRLERKDAPARVTRVKNKKG